MRIRPTSALGVAVVTLTAFFGGASAQEACPRNAGALVAGGSLTCRCAADQLTGGTVYGSARYSSDSSLCRAARHAGVIPDDGGVVTVHAVEGCSRFIGSNANGIATNNWSSAVAKTFAFVSPAPPCPAAAAAPAPSGPPTGSPMAGWEARATAYAAALPEALPGWKANERQTVVQNSAMSGREVTGYRIYRLGQYPANLDAISIYIRNNPDGSPRYPIDNWRDEAKRNAASMKMVKAGGRDAMEGKSGDITTIWFLMPNNLFVGLSWQETHVKREQVDAYIKAIDFAKIEALASK